MLLYADDMVLWAETEEELELKVSVVHKALGELNLKLNPSKTELQHNNFATPRVGQYLTVESEYETGIKIRFLDPDKPIRYLGAWTTCNKNTDYGLQLLKEKCSIGWKEYNTVRHTQQQRLCWQKVKYFHYGARHQCRTSVVLLLKSGTPSCVISSRNMDLPSVVKIWCI
jgi:hypothetical protein